MMADFHFLRPAWFLALAPLAALVWWALRGRARGGAWSRVCDAALLPFVVESEGAHLRRGAGWLLGAAATLAVTAAAGPTWERLPVPVFRGDAALVIALDLSASMNAEDLKPSRLVRARYKVADLLRARRTGQTALVVFAAQAFVVTPLTNDNETINAQLQALDTSIMPVQGSNPAAALELAGKLLTQAGMPRGHVLLVTDGAEPAALEKARAAAGAADFTLSVLGIGSADGAPIPDTNGGFLKDGGQLVIARLDAGGLATLAKAGGGQYLEARADDEDVAALDRYLDDDRAAHVRELDKLASSQWHEVGAWLLLPLLPLAALAFRRGLLLLCAACALGALLPGTARADWWRTPDQAGQAAFDAHDYAAAAQRFADPAWRAAARYRAGDFAGASHDLSGRENESDLYNRGNALARQGELQAAMEAYERALKLNPDDEDARHNRDAVARALREQEKKDDKASDQQNGKSGEKRKPSQSERGEQQFNGEKGGSSNQDTSGATNAGGGAESKDVQHSDDQAGDNAQAKGKSHDRQAQSSQDNEEKEGKQAERGRRDQQNDESSAERERATEQWLGQIPDDPSGLLRRKFEFQYKQRYGDAPTGGSPW